MKINLLPRPEPSHQYFTIGLTGAAGLLLLANLWAGTVWITSEAERRIADGRYESASLRLAQLEKQVAEQRKRSELTRQIEAFNRWAASRPNFQDEVHLLSALLPKNSALLTVHFAGDADYDIRASFPDLDSVATYLRQLQESPRVVSLKVKSVTLQTVTLTPTAGQPAAGAANPGTQPAPPSGTPASPAPNAGNRTAAAQTANGGTAFRTLWDRLLAFLPWGAREALASDGPVPDQNPAPSGVPPTGGATGAGTAPQTNPPSGPTPPGQGTAPQPGAVPAAPGTSPEPGGAPATKTVYELDLTVTLGR